MCTVHALYVFLYFYTTADVQDTNVCVGLYLSRNCTIYITLLGTYYSFKFCFAFWHSDCVFEKCEQ